MNEEIKKKACVADINIMDERVKQKIVDTSHKPVKSIEEFIQRIRCVSRGKENECGVKWPVPWFRGECVTEEYIKKDNFKEEDINYYNPLWPKLYRKSRANDPDYSENKLLQHFRMKAPVFSSDLVPERDETDKWLFLAQHVGLPTRLLDWTESAMVALYFALKEKKAVHSFVWMLDPISLNKKSINKKSGAFNKSEFPLTWINNLGNINIRGAWEENVPGTKLPVAILPTNIHPRMSVQRSCFTIHGKKKDSLAELALKYFKKEAHAQLPLEYFSEYLICYKLSDEASHLKQMREDLQMLGVTHSALFPDLDGLAVELDSLDYYKRP